MRQASTWTPSPDIQLQEFHPLPLERLDFGRQLLRWGPGDERRCPWAERQARSRAACRDARSLEGPAARGRDVVPVDAARVGRADPLGRPLAVQADPVKEPLGRILRRSRDVHPAGRLVHGIHTDDVVIARGQQADILAVARDRVGMAPTVPLAQPEQGLAAAQPDEIVHGLDPGLVRVDEDGPGLAGCGLGDQHRVVFCSRLRCWKTTSRELPAQSMRGM